ncbi:Dyp-type peroxidase [Cellulosimicrobium terreum]|nr:Dyp-type peroxidase [Cellulosimicrobium terreum]
MVEPREDEAQPSPGPQRAERPPGPSRRAFVAGLLTSGAAGTAVGAGVVVAGSDRGTDPATAPSGGTGGTSSGTSPYGVHQAGVAVPDPTQRSAETLVLDLPDDVALHPDPLAELLAGLGETIAALAAGDHAGLAGLDPAGLTVTVGLGPRVVVATLGTGPGADELPAFTSDDLTERRTGGDLLLLVRSDEDAVVALAGQVLAAEVARASGPADERAHVRWSAPGFRGPLAGPGNRNLTGFRDGLSVPRGDEELEAAVWWDDAVRPGMEGATVAVVRVMPFDVNAFTALPVAAQEEAVGRRRAGGEPLSGGTALDDPDLRAKDDTGRYAIGVDAHVRRAHPLPAGLDTLMLRRSYSFTGAETGLVFVAFHRELDTFVRTQQRLDEGDALTALARTTASGTFLVLPGYDAERPLGAALRG